MAYNLSALLRGLAPYFLRKKGSNTIAGDIYVEDGSTYNLGSASKPFANIYADNLVGTTPNASDELVKATSSDSTPGYLTEKLVAGPGIIKNDGSGVGSTVSLAADYNAVILRSGTNSLLGNLAVSNGVTIDGVDLDQHAINPTAHQDLASALDTSTTIVGQAIGVNLATTSGLEIVNGVRLADSVAGGGLGIASKVISVGAGNGIIVNTSDITLQLQTDSGLLLDGTGLAINEGVGLEIVTNALNVKLQSPDSGLTVDSSGVALGAVGTLSVTTTNAISGNTHYHQITTDSDVGSAPARAILASTVDGNLDLANLGLWGNLEFRGGDRYINATGNLTISPTTNLVLDPTGTVIVPNAQVMQTVSHSDLVTGITGWNISETISTVSQLTIGAVKVDELYARVFVADEVRIDRGEEYWSKSFGIVETEFDLPADEATVDVWFEDSPGLAGANLFTVNDWLLLRNIDWDTSIAIQRVWFQAVLKVATGTGADGTTRQQWRIRRKVGGTTGLTISKGATILDAGQLGQGWVHLSALQQDKGPFIQVGKMTTEGDATNVPVHTNYVRFGNLNGIGGIGTDQWGIAAASDLGVTIGSGYEGFVLEESTGLRLYNTEMRLYNADVLATRLWAEGLEMNDSTGAINALSIFTGSTSSSRGGKTLNNGDVIIGDSVYGAGGYIWFDKSTGNLEVKGSINIIGTIPAGDVSGLGAGAFWTNLDNVPNGSTYVRTTPNQRDGGGRAYSTIDSNNRVVGLVKPTTNAKLAPDFGSGLYLGSDYMGFYNGSAWRTYMQSNGDFYLAGTGSQGLTWTSNTLTIEGTVIITGGSSGITSFSDAGSLVTKDNVNLATEVTNKSLANLDSTANTKLTGIAYGATVGGTWGTNIGNIPTELTDGRIVDGLDANGNLLTKVLPGANVLTPSGAGLYLGKDKMGFYNGSKWKTYMNNSGEFYFAGAGSGAIAWDGTDLYGTNGTTVQWEASSADGKMRAGQGQVIIDVNGITLPHTAGAFVEQAELTFKNGSTTISKIGSGSDAFGQTSKLYLDGPGVTSLEFISNISAGDYISSNSDFYAPSIQGSSSLYARGAYGYVRVQAATSGTSTGWVGWYTNVGTRLGYIGADSNNIKLQTENGAIVDVNGSMDVSGTVTLGSFGSWTNLSLATGWTNFNTGTHTRASYIRIGNMIYLRGVIYRSSTQTTVLTMPSGTRPSREHVFVAQAYNGTRRVGIATSGVVTMYNEGSGDANTYLSLDGIVFSTS